jgi:uncharacterized protein
MKIFDFNVHLPYLTDPDVNKVIAQDLHLDSQGIIKGFNTHYEYFSSVLGSNFLLFNTSLFDRSQADFKNLLERTPGDFTTTALIDVRSERIESYIDSLVANGVRAVMVNSYLQQIDTNDFPKALRAFRYAAQKGLIICIDGSYGTSQMYTYDNMKLACYIADHISNVPIVIVHAGGYRVVEAMLLALDKNNVWLDTSFSLPYYIGSSIEQDFAYVIRKLNFERVVFGSDHPYIPFESALSAHQSFFEKHHFNDTQISKVLYENAIKLFGI